jgi:hypothetical protein
MKEIQLTQGQMTMEEWKDVKGWEGIYQVSNYGRLKSFKRNPMGHILSNKNKTGEYLSVILVIEGRMQSTRMHRLVAEAFVPNPHGRPEVNHKDRNKQNNHWFNLEWVNRRENNLHSISINPGQLSGMHAYNKLIRPRPISQHTIEGKMIGIYPNAVEASRATGVCARNIIQVAAKTEYRPGMTRKQAGGYVWRYENAS